MLTLSEYQRALRDLLKERSGPPPDDYLRRVACSPGLAVMRETALWWLALAVERQCPWTSRLLRRLGLYPSRIASFYQRLSISPYPEQIGEQFLADTSGDGGLVGTLARFERAVYRVKRGDTQEYCVEWDRHPDALFRCLMSGAELPPPVTGSVYRTFVSSRIPDLVRCDRISRAVVP